MKLNEFIKETLVQINKGVMDAQEETKGTGLLINPEGIMVSKEQIEINSHQKNIRQLQLVKMSIVITVDETNEKKGGINVFTSVFNMGGSLKDVDVSSVTNRIEFEIPISLPQMKE
jgi:hypothetical protein